MPTLESHIVVEESAEGRKLVANPYFHMVDTAGNQLPYISEIAETYIGDKEVQNLKIMNGEVVWKQQAVFLEDFPLLKENEGKGNYTVSFAPTFGENVFFSFNRTHKDPVLAEIFSDIRFNKAMSIAMNRGEINEIVYLGQGTPMQGVPAEPKTVSFITEEMLNKDIAYDRRWRQGPARRNGPERCRWRRHPGASGRQAAGGASGLFDARRSGEDDGTGARLLVRCRRPRSTSRKSPPTSIAQPATTTTWT